MVATTPPCPLRPRGASHRSRGGVLRWCRTRNEGTDFGAPERPTPTDHRRRATGTSLWEAFCSACSPAAGGRPDRVRGDVRARRLGELGASVDPTASGPP